MRTWPALTIIAITSLTAPLAYADSDPFAVMRDPKQHWIYQPMLGPLAALKPIKGAPLATCTITEVTKIVEVTRATFTCTTDVAPPPGSESWGGDAGLAIYTTARLVFDSDRMREVWYAFDAIKSLHSPANTSGLTFPNVVPPGGWKQDHALDDDTGLAAEVSVKETTASVLGKSRKVWVSDSKRWKRGNTGEPDYRNAATYAPGVGPVLICATEPFEKGQWWCLKLTKVSVSS